MSTHPNVILMAVLTPKGLARQTMKDILTYQHVYGDDEDDDIKIDGVGYHHITMESDYHEDWQLSAKEGDLLFFDLVTYGYGERVTWSELEQRKTSLDAWASDVSQRFHCDYEIVVTANYW